MDVSGSIEVLSQSELDLILGSAILILARTGVAVENEELLKLLADDGAEVDFGEQRARFPEAYTERLLSESEEDYADEDGVECSCLFPCGNRREYAKGVEVTAGTYPQYYLSPDGEITPHTVETASDMTRLADALDGFDRLGVMGIPSDVPTELGPLHLRLIAWKHAERKLSNCGEVRELALLPYVFEMGEIMADHKREPVRRYTFAEVEMISPLKFTRVEAETFVQFWKKGLLAGVGFMHSAGGSAPATLAGTVALDLAESLFICALYRACYGWKKLWLQCNSSVMDMRLGMYPFGRPEKGLLLLAMGQIARHVGAGIWPAAHYADAKEPSIEAGIQSAFNTVPAILAGATGLECFGILSTGEIGSPIQLVIDNEYSHALKRFARGFEVSEEIIAADLIDAVGPGGLFAGTDHTVKHFRQEHWQPKLFSCEPLNAWLAGDQKTATDKAREVYEQILREHHPRGIDDETEQRLLDVIDRARKAIVA